MIMNDEDSYNLKKVCFYYKVTKMLDHWLIIQIIGDT